MYGKMEQKEKDHLYKLFVRERKQAVGMKMRFNMMQVIQAIKRATGTRREVKHKMMWEDEFYEFAGSVPGGKLTPHEQKQEWTRLLSDELVPKDNGGPRGARRCLVVIGNYIVDYDDVCREDQAQAFTPLKKKATAEDFNKAAKALLNGKDEDAFECIDGKDFEQMRHSMKNVMVHNVDEESGNLVSGALLAPNVKQLAESNPRKKPKVAAPAAAAAAEEWQWGSEEEAKGAQWSQSEWDQWNAEQEKKAPGPWDRREADVAKKKRTITLAFEKLEASARDQYSQAGAGLDIFQKRISADEKAFYQIELSALEKRVNTLALVLQGDAAQLDSALSQYEKQISAGNSDQQSLSRLPPIVNWRHLKPIRAVDAMLVAVVSSPTVKELDANAHKCTMLQNAIQDLVTGCKSAHSQLIAAMSERVKAKKRAKDDQAKSAQERVELMAGEPSPKARRTSAERPTMWEFAPSSEQEIITFSHEDFERYKNKREIFKRPFIITNAATSMMQAVPMLEKEFEDFKQFWRQSDARKPTGNGRGQRNVHNDLEHSLNKAIEDAIPGCGEKWAIDFNGGVCEAPCRPALFAMCRENYGFERSCLASIRVKMGGTSRCCLVDFCSLGQYVRLKKGGRVRSMPISSAHVCNWLGGADPNEIKSYYDEVGCGHVLWGTLGPSDVLYTPAGHSTSI